MCRCLRSDISETEALIVLVDNVRRNFASDDLFEQRHNKNEGGGEAVKGPDLLEELPLHRIVLGSLLQSLNLGNELSDIIELAINRNVSDIGYGIDAVELIHHLGPDASRGNLMLMIFMELAQDLIHCTSDAIHRDLSFLAGLHQPSKKLLSIDRFARAVTLDDAELGPLHLFVSRKS